MYRHCSDEGFNDYVKELLLFHKVVSVQARNDQNAELVLDNGTVLEVYGNIGCGGCENGWYYLTALNKCDNAITNVEVVQDEYETVFSIFVYADDTRINLVTYEGDDNGYYGTGYYLRVKVNIGG
jgi:hypothetical protein